MNTTELKSLYDRLESARVALGWTSVRNSPERLRALKDEARHLERRLRQIGKAASP
jgi:hypothetical protein